MEISENFATMLKRLVHAGPPPEWKGSNWNWEEFLAAVGAAVYPKRGFHERTYLNWTNPEASPPPRKTFDAICTVLFGTNAALDDAKQALVRAWEATKKRRASGKSDQTKGVAPPQPAPDEQTAPLVPVCSRRMINLPMVDLNIEKPPQGGTSDRFGLLVDARPGLEPCPEDSDYAFGLNRLTLLYQEENCRPVGKRHGEDGAVPGLEAIAGGWRLTAPPGDPLTEAHRLVEILATFERDGEGVPSVMLKPTAQTSDVVPTLKGSAANLPAKARGVLGRFLVAKNFPKKGIIEFGHATLTFKPAKS